MTAISLPARKPGKASPATLVSATFATVRARLLIVSRYKGQLFNEILTPIVLAAMPILLGRATAGDRAAEVFLANTGTANYVGFMLIGSATFVIVSNAFWHIANWLRWEMETGTLESIYLTPTHRVFVAAGTGIYSTSRSTVGAFVAYLIGSAIMGINPFQGDLLIAFLFILCGLIPLFGMTLFYGALVLKLKEANAMLNLMQWVVNFLMGVFFPITVMPAAAQLVAKLFPPTWMTNGVRSAMLGVGYFFGEWYLDLAVLWFFMLAAPMLGIWAFKKIENSVRRNEGVGQF
ncbi:MAG: ABC transporter permease [Chloroflexi bacterium]|nr:ABC transporter permease [Chloroflexota bacterium]